MQISDIHITLASSNNETFKAMIMTDKTPMPFGKHKGILMANVPASYLLWLESEGCKDILVSKYISDNIDLLRAEAAKNKRANNRFNSR